MTLQLLHSKFSYIWGKNDFLFYQCRQVESGGGRACGKKFSVATNALWLADLYKLGFYFRNRQLTTFLCHSDSPFCYVFYILSDTGLGGVPAIPEMVVQWWPLQSVSLTTFLVTLTYNSSMIYIPRYRMRRSACGTGNSGAMVTIAIGFTDKLSCNSYSQFFYDFYSQTPDEEECLRYRIWGCHDDHCHRFHWPPYL